MHVIIAADEYSFLQHCNCQLHATFS